VPKPYFAKFADLQHVVRENPHFQPFPLAVRLTIRCEVMP
jgi:hypothetical protein